MKKILGPLAHIIPSTAILIFISSALSFTFSALTLDAMLATALAVSLTSWFIYNVVGFAVCAPLAIKKPGFALPTVLGVISLAAAIVFIGWLFPGTVLTHSFWAATPFALVDTLAIWASAILTGSLKDKQTLWPQR